MPELETSVFVLPEKLTKKGDRITTHYSAPDIARLLAAANSICEPQQATVLRIVRPAVEGLPENSGKIPAAARPAKSRGRAR